MPGENIPFLSGLNDINMIPQSLNFDWVSNSFPVIMWCIIIGLTLLMISRFMSHRIFVEKLIQVQGGYVAKGGRYAVSYDKVSNLRYLRPMWGKDKLPDFPERYFQKVEGTPIFGIKRELSLLFPNENSPIVSLPPINMSTEGITKEVDIKRWFFMNQRSKFIKKIKSGDFIYFLSIFAPSIIILGTIAFFVVLIFMQINITSNLADKLNEMVGILMEVCSSG